MHARRERTQVAAVGLAAVMGAGASACVIHQGDGWRVDRSISANVAPTPSRGTAGAGVSLVVFGAPAPGAAARRVAERVDAVLQAEGQAGRTTGVVWTGDNVFPAGLGEGDSCLDPEAAWTRRGLAELAAAVAPARSEGQLGSWATLGRRDWACGAPDLQVGAEAHASQPYRIPDHHYVVRMWADGRNRVVSRCLGDDCRVEPPGGADPPVLDLVVVDQTPFLFPPESEVGVLHGALINAQLEALLAELAPPEALEVYVPRILVSHAAVESAGIHGQGGLRPTATVHRLHPAVRAAVTEGRVRGVLAGLDRSLQLAEDLDPAVQRVAKIWIERPVFQVVSGAAGRPDGRAVPLSRRQLWWNQGIGIVNAEYSTHPGFAVVRVMDDTIELELHARRLGRWELAWHVVPREVESLPRARATPPMTPCPRCDPTQSPANR